MPPRKRAAPTAKKPAAKKPAAGKPMRGKPPAAIKKLPPMHAPGRDPDDPDRRRRAEEYAARTGRQAARPAKHCPTCTCAGAR